jgi:hypothetical protein
MFVWQGPAPNLDPGPFRPPNPEPRTQNHWSIVFLRVSENILISSLQLSCLLQIIQLIEPKKMSNLLGFAHVFEMETSLFLWHLLWHCLCTPKFYPKYSKIFFCPHPKGWKRANSMCRSWLYIYTLYKEYIHILLYIYILYIYILYMIFIYYIIYKYNYIIFYNIILCYIILYVFYILYNFYIVYYIIFFYYHIIFYFIYIYYTYIYYVDYIIYYI